MRGEPRNALHAQLVSDSTDVADLRWLAGIRPLGAAAAASSAASAAAKERGDFAALRTIDGDVNLVAKRVHAAEMAWLESARLEASLVDGRLTVPRFDVGVARGHLAGHAAVDAHEGPARVELDATLRGAGLEQLLHQPRDKARITGALHGRAQLKASGDSASALLASSSGSLTASLVGGTVSSLLDAEMGLQGGKILRSLIAGAEPLPIRCAAAALDIERGAGRIRALVLDTERTRTTGTGTIDLAHETFDIVLTPEAKQGGLFVLERSIRLHGPLRQPARELVARGRAGLRSGAGLPGRPALTAPALAPSGASACSCRTGSRSGRRRSRRCGCARRAPGSAP